MNEPLEFTKRLVVDAGKILLDYYRSYRIKQSQKADNSIITEADLASDEIIRNAIRNEYPEDGILSEEENTIYPFGKRFVWVIDPLDGTTNYSLGLHHWGVLITRLLNGKPVLTVLHFPLLCETFIAIRGKGATLNGNQIQVIPEENIGKATFFSCCSRTHQKFHVDIPYKTRVLGSAGYGLTTVAKGSAILAFEVIPKIWDFVGSWLITQESGGYIAPLNCENIFPMQPGIDYQKVSYPILSAITKKYWEYGRERIQPNP
jgi:myo-inositol-1(or 4)-monophosphatase